MPTRCFEPQPPEFHLVRQIPAAGPRRTTQSTLRSSVSQAISQTATLRDDGVPDEACLMTRDAGSNAEETGQRYTEAPTDLEGLKARMFHQPVPERLLAHLRNRYGIDAVAATQVSVHRADVFRIDRADGDAVSDFEGSSVLVTEFIHGERIPPFTDNMTVMADLLGRLHALPLDDTVTRPGGAQGIDPSHEGSPRQDLLAALALLDAVDTRVAPEARDRF